MPATSIVDRLRRGDILLMDGGTGTELHRRGVNISKGATVEKRPTAPAQYAEQRVPGVTYKSVTGLGVWSAPANLEAPDVVRAVHEDYLRLGAEVIITNTFYTTRAMLSKIGEADRWEDYARRAVAIAKEARDRLNPEAYLAGGVAPPFTGNLRNELEAAARVFKDAGVDFMLPEYFGGDTIHENPIADCVTAVDACATSGLPVFLGVCNVKESGTLLYGETFPDLVKALKGHPLSGILLMCTQPPAVSACLPRLRAAYDGPIGAYAELGYEENPNFGNPGEQFFVIEGKEYTPARYADYAREWKRMGAQVIGGCCGTGPEHIEAVRAAIRE
jgi:S-methylmethionine-dependent homocysteine/selenocysteine methylase